jgi:glycosyltransferase involved in cell wall biosynthesis
MKNALSSGGGLRHGAIDVRRSAVAWTGIGQYVERLKSLLPDVMGADAPVFVSGGGLSLRTNGGTREDDVLRTGRKFLWEQVTEPFWTHLTHPAFLHLPWYEGPHIITAPLLVTVHDLDTLIHPQRYSFKFRAYYNGLLRHYARTATRLITDSHTSAADIERHLAPARATVVYPGVGMEFRTPDPSRGREIIRSLGLPADRPVAISASGLGLRKNLGVLADGLEICARKGSHLSLVITQTGLVPELFGRAQAAGVVVRAAGKLPRADLAAVYAAADVSVSPSLYEGFGLSIVEAFAAGCPVVASDAGSHPEIADGAALLFQATNAHELAEHLCAVLSSPGVSAALRSRGRDRAADFDWLTTVRQTAAIYYDLMD